MWLITKITALTNKIEFYNFSYSITCTSSNRSLANILCLYIESFKLKVLFMIL